MSKRVFIVFAFILLVVGLAIVASPFKKQDRDKKEIVLGGIYSLSGDNAVLGQAEKNASLLAIEEINASGGINGSPISVIWEDGKCSGKDGLTAAQKLISVDRIHIILAGGCSSEVLGFAPLAEKEKVITMDITGTSPDIAQAGERIFRNVPNDSYAAAALAEYARKRGNVRAATLFEETDYAKALNRDFVALFKARDGDVVTQESFLTTSKDIRTQATKIKSLNPEIIFLAPQSSKSGIMAAKQLKELGVGTPLLTSAEVLLTGDEKEFQLMKELFEGAVLSQLDFGAVDKSRLNDFNKRYKERFGKSCEIGEYYCGFGYEMVYLLEGGLKRCGEDNDCLKDYFYSIKDWPGIMGLLTIDKSGDAIRKYTIQKIQDGKTVPIE